MPSLARTHQLKSSLLYHVYNRGNFRKEIFHDDQDYRRFIELLSSYTEKCDFDIYHWVLMPNHYHLLLEISIPEKLSSAFAGLARSYVYYHHNKYQTSGHLWQGRFKTQAIQKELYLLSCGRYIERNPVKAGLVKNAEDYGYSSAAYYVYGKQDKIAAESPLFRSLGNTLESARKKYRDFLKDFNVEEEKLFENLEEPQGSQEFKRRLIKEKGLLLPKRRGRP